MCNSKKPHFSSNLIFTACLIKMHAQRYFQNKLFKKFISTKLICNYLRLDFLNMGELVHNYVSIHMPPKNKWAWHVAKLLFRSLLSAVLALPNLNHIGMYNSGCTIKSRYRKGNIHTTTISIYTLQCRSWSSDQGSSTNEVAKITLF